MASSRPLSNPASTPPVAVGVRAAYDAVARAYDAQLKDELDHKPLDRALLGAFVELVGVGTVADVGCGPGHVTRFLAAQHADVVGVDVSDGMICVARERAPELRFVVGSMVQLPVADQSVAGVVALYSIIHLTANDRASTWRAFARALRPGGWLLVAFHVSSDEFGSGDVNHLTSWFGQSVELDGYFLEPSEVESELATAGFALTARVDRQGAPAVEYPSRRCYLLAQRRGPH